MKTLLTIAVLSLSVAGSPQITNAQSRRATVNGVALSQQVQAQYRISARRYWYDQRSGLWGFEGGPARGLIRAGLRIGGRLRVNASRGTAPVLINGRRLPWTEVAYIKRLTGVVYPGSYWLDSRGNVGRVGGPALTNLRALAMRRSGGNSRGAGRWSGSSGGYRRHHNWYTGTNVVSGGGFIGISGRVGGKRFTYIR